ncbi:RHS repeat-associated core domain-containing protein [Streptomyces wedmorensis]
MVTGLDDRLAATTAKTGGTVLQLTNVHGDVSLLLPLDAGVAPTVLDADEYGNPRAGQVDARYGWLGARQRSGETVSGLTLMGVRLYNSATGRFLSTDPVRGGSCNAYEYVCGDPVNMLDLDGRMAVAALVASAGLGVRPAGASPRRPTSTSGDRLTIWVTLTSTLEACPSVRHAFRRSFDGRRYQPRAAHGFFKVSNHRRCRVTPGPADP